MARERLTDRTTDTTFYGGYGLTVTHNRRC